MLQKIILNNTKFYRPAQKEIFKDCLARFICVKAGRRFGKSKGAMRWLVTQALKNKRLDLPCFWVAPIIETSRKVFDKFLKEYKKVIRSKNISRRQIILINGREIFFCGCDKPESLEGEGLWALVFDEVRHVKTDTVWMETLTPMLGDAVKEDGGKAIIITTPRTRLHWLSQLVKRIQKGEEGPEFAAFVKTTLEGGNIPASEIERAKRILPADIFKRNYEALDTALSGLVYPEYNPDIHLIPEVPSWFFPYYNTCGLDFGATEEHPTVFVPTSQDNSKRFNIVLEEKYIYQANIEQILRAAHKIHKEHRIQKFFCDHNRPDFVRRMQSEGLPAVLTKKGPDSVFYGIECVRELLYIVKDTEKPRLYFVEGKTKELQTEIEDYQFKEGTEVPDKAAGHDDGMDALRYNLYMTNTKHRMIQIRNM